MRLDTFSPPLPTVAILAQAALDGKSSSYRNSSQLAILYFAPPTRSRATKKGVVRPPRQKKGPPTGAPQRSQSHRGGPSSFPSGTAQPTQDDGRHLAPQAGPPQAPSPLLTAFAGSKGPGWPAQAPSQSLQFKDTTAPLRRSGVSFGDPLQVQVALKRALQASIGSRSLQFLVVTLSGRSFNSRPSRVPQGGHPRGAHCRISALCVVECARSKTWLRRAARRRRLRCNHCRRRSAGPK